MSKGGEKAFIQSYLCGIAPVQNSLPEARRPRVYAARSAPTGGPEKESSRRGQAERLRETALRPAWRANCRPVTKRWGSRPDDPSAIGYARSRRRATWVLHVAAWRKRPRVLPVRSYAVRRSVSRAYKPPAKGLRRCGRRGEGRLGRPLLEDHSRSGVLPSSDGKKGETAGDGERRRVHEES